MFTDEPETIHTVRILGDYLYEWSREDCLLKRTNKEGTLTVITEVVNPNRIDTEIKKDFRAR